MRAPLKRTTRLIGARWLREEVSRGVTEGDGVGNVQEKETASICGATVMSNNQDNNQSWVDHGIGIPTVKKSGVNPVTANQTYNQEEINTSVPNKIGIIIVENKKRRTYDGLEHNETMGLDTELNKNVDNMNVENMDHDITSNKDGYKDPKNAKGAGSRLRACLALWVL